MLSYYAFKIPFKTSFRISNQTLKTRNGILLVFDAGDFLAYGEVAPLPGFSKESIEQVIPILIENQKHLESAFRQNNIEQVLSILDSIHQFPSLSFALDSLALDLQSKRNKKSLSETLFNKKTNSLRVNGTIGIFNVEDTLERATKLVDDGFSTLKVKVGVDYKRELTIIKALRQSHPKVKIRLDANQAWNVNEAIRCLKSFETFEIEFCEQPVSASNIVGLKKVKEAVEIPIAADEAVRTFHQAKKLIESDACDLLILKPSLIGRIKNCIVTKEWANSHNIDVVVTTAFDTIVGRTITAVLASGIGSEKYAHGLATGQFLIEPVKIPQEIDKGTYLLPSSPGISQNIDFSYFHKIS